MACGPLFWPAGSGSDARGEQAATSEAASAQPTSSSSSTGAIASSEASDCGSSMNSSWVKPAARKVRNASAISHAEPVIALPNIPVYSAAARGATTIPADRPT
jgi:hypothetical protein